MEGSKIPLLSRVGGKNRMGKLVGQNKDRETVFCMCCPYLQCDSSCPTLSS